MRSGFFFWTLIRPIGLISDDYLFSVIIFVLFSYFSRQSASLVDDFISFSKRSRNNSRFVFSIRFLIRSFRFFESSCKFWEMMTKSGRFQKARFKFVIVSLMVRCNVVTYYCQFYIFIREICTCFLCSKNRFVYLFACLIVRSSVSI